MKLNHRHKKLIAALLSQKNIREACHAAGVSEKSYYNWMQDDDFRRELERAEEQLLASVARQLTSASEQAATLLREVMDDSEANVSQKIRAAKAVLQSLPSLRLLSSIEHKLELLEREASTKAD